MIGEQASNYEVKRCLHETTPGIVPLHGLGRCLDMASDEKRSSTSSLWAGQPHRCGGYTPQTKAQLAPFAACSSTKDTEMADIIQRHSGLFVAAANDDRFDRAAVDTPTEQFYYRRAISKR